MVVGGVRVVAAAHHPVVVRRAPGVGDGGEVLGAGQAAEIAGLVAELLAECRQDGFRGVLVVPELGCAADNLELRLALAPGDGALAADDALDVGVELVGPPAAGKDVVECFR